MNEDPFAYDQAVISSEPTLWGLTPMQLHERFWRSNGACTVRPNHTDELPTASLYLLLNSATLVLFDLPPLLRMMARANVSLLLLRLHGSGAEPTREHLELDHAAATPIYRRHYQQPTERVVRAALTRDASLARLWQTAGRTRSAWRAIRDATPRASRMTRSRPARLYSADDPRQAEPFAMELARHWLRPDHAISRARRLDDAAWVDPHAAPPPQTRLIGPVWIGAGQRLDDMGHVPGPAVLWDQPDHCPSPGPTPEFPTRVVPGSIRIRHQAYVAPRPEPWGKRVFDMLASTVGLSLLLPTLFPAIALAIWIEDGRPIFYAHQRQTRTGRSFACLKFRSMSKRAERLKPDLDNANQADGPQFYIEDDPRLTRVGRVMRKLNLDELPQLFNVLTGDMSLVGPRPSPHEENQFCPAWRHARLSVRPGITGLWQVKRSRAPGLDFQEWIRYDIEYVENQSWKLDLRILARTFLQMARLRR